MFTEVVLERLQVLEDYSMIIVELPCRKMLSQ